MIKAVIFDWGDTVMEDLPSKAGPMAEWDVVQETPGIRQVLEALHGHVQIILATNAAESGEKKIRLALGRVGLDGLFRCHLFRQGIGREQTRPAVFPIHSGLPRFATRTGCDGGRRSDQ